MFIAKVTEPQRVLVKYLFRAFHISSHGQLRAHSTVTNE
jgi:hypothetical protein